MPKRSTTESVLQNLSQADKDANALKVAALAKIPDPVWEAVIDFTKVYSDHIFNSRDEDSYAFSANKALFTSLKEKGLEKRGDPMSFLLMEDGRLKVLVGNLRFTMMTEIRREEIERRKSAGEAEDFESLPFASVFGLVYQGLTPGQQTAIMADHIGRKDLNEFERCKEIGEFIEQNGLTDDQAKTHFGMDKNKVRRYRMRWSMPTVMAEFRKEKAGKGSTESYISIGQKQLEGLYSAYLKDRDAGNRHRQEGPCFRRAWELIKSDPNAFKPAGGSSDSMPEAKKRATILEQADSCVAGFGDTPEIIAIRETLRFAAGEEVNLNEVRQGLKDYCESLRVEIETLNGLVLDSNVVCEELTNANTAYLAELTNLQTDIIGLKTDLQTANEHIVTMRSELETAEQKAESLKNEVNNVRGTNNRKSR